MTIQPKTTFEHTCTCGIKDGDEEHQEWCDLFACDAWFMGKATWYNGKLWDNEELWGWDDAPVEVTLEPNDDDEYECDCLPFGDESVEWTTKHSAECNLQNHTAWMDGICEWDHMTRTFVYLDEVENTKPATTPSSTLWGDDDYYAGVYSGTGGWGGPGGKQLCNHDGTKAIEFPDGTRVYPSSSHATSKRTSYPDFALYLESSRMPYSIATYIPWKDYGLPSVNFQHAADTIVEMFSLARQGYTVEVGCIGAHGRTGTVLACMAVLAGVPTHEAVDYVRTHHCDHAVESEDQRWWIRWFDAYVHGLPTPPTPPPPAPLPASTATTTGQAPQCKVGDTAGDMKRGDPCPRCAKPVVMIGAAGGNRLACNTKACDYYDGLPQCPGCKVHLDAHALEGYSCWNIHCVRYNLKANSSEASLPPAPKPKPKQKTWGKGRKKK